MEPPGERTRGAGHRSAAPASRAPQLGGSPPCQSHARCRDHGGAVVCGLPALDDRGAEMVDGTGTPLSVTRCCVRQAEDTTLLQRPQQLWGTSPCHAGVQPSTTQRLQAFRCSTLPSTCIAGHWGRLLQTQLTASRFSIQPDEQLCSWTHMPAQWPQCSLTCTSDLKVNSMLEHHSQLHTTFGKSS
jgi:hypothetical protein